MYLNPNYRKTRNYFMNRLQLDFTTITNIVKDFGDEKGIIDHNEAANAIQQDWDAFMSWWGKNGRKYKVKNGYNHR